MIKVYDSARAVKDSIPAGKTITLVGGTFDLLHVGHLHLLEYAKKLETILVVCVLSDKNVKSYKDFNRPIIKEVYRASMVAALQCSDFVYISDMDTNHQDMLSLIKPDSVVFGIDDTNHCRQTAKKREQMIRSNFPNIKIHYLERFYDESVSTSAFIHKIKES
ncbi:MAG: D,D-heptose 1-phosphate adenosyltransferase / D,D-heptose 7-phosphate kinase [Candidatus Parcubacteria bacterium]|jgi:cytidyltransferase-like protein